MKRPDSAMKVAALRREVARLARELAAAEERFCVTAGGLLDAFFLLEAERDLGGVIRDFTFAQLNEIGEKLVALPREQVLGKRLCELLPVNRERGYFAKYARVVESGEPMLEEARFEAADGIHVSWLQFQAVKVGDGVAIHAKDITARKIQEAEVHRLFEELQMIFNAVPSLIFFKDCQNHLVRVNRAAAAHMGLPVEEIEGRSCEEFWPEEAASYYRDDLEVLRSGKPKLGYVEAQTLPGGERAWIRTDKSPLFDAQGRPLGVLAVITDITAERKAALQAAVLEKAVEERRTLGRDLHDGIGQQFTGLRMLIEKVRRQACRGEVPQLGPLDEIAAVIDAASTEVRRMISGLTPEHISAEDLPGALGQIAANVQRFYQVVSVSECKGDFGAIGEFAANHFLAIAQEAAINAARHAGAERIQIQLASDEAGFVLSVSDDGCGLPAGLKHSGSDSSIPSLGGGAQVVGVEGGPGTGRGMTILQQRAAVIGARLEVGPARSEAEPSVSGTRSSNPPQPARRPGTLIRCILPR